MGDQKDAQVLPGLHEKNTFLVLDSEPSTPLAGGRTRAKTDPAGLQTFVDGAEDGEADSRLTTADASGRSGSEADEDDRPRLETMLGADLDMALGAPAGLDLSSDLDMSSWKTNSGFQSWRPEGGMLPPFGGMAPGLEAGDFGEGAMLTPDAMGGMFWGAMPSGVPGPWGCPPGGASMYYNGAMPSAADLEAKAAHLEALAAQYKMAAQQTGAVAQQKRETENDTRSSASPMMGPMGDWLGAFGGYAGGSPAVIPNPQWHPPPMLHEAAATPSGRAKPKKASSSSASKSASSALPGERTTIMLRNIPNNYNRDMVLELLDAEGFATRYDFVYLPMDFHRTAGLGYAFVNLVSVSTAEEMKSHFHGFTAWKLASQKVCEVAWGEPLQGLEAHIERYRNSPVMHEDVPDKYKPVLYRNGERIPFPAPTKRLRPPRVKRSCAGGGKDDHDGVDGDF